jgi:two-component system, cell cycle sensor histidine kinase and response regulator CckA
MDATTQAPPAIESDHDLRFSQAFEAAAIGMAICHLDGRILGANSALEHMLGYDRHALDGIDPWRFQPPELPRSDSAKDKDSTSDSRLLAELMRGERNSFAVEKRFRRKDGSEFWGQLTVSLARDGHDEPGFLMALLEDATERKRVEESLRQAEKMEVIGRLAGGIAHDFNNLLTGILLYCDLMLSELESNHRLRHHVEEVRMAGEQCGALTQQLLAMARKQAAEPRPLAINEVVSSTENLLRRLIGEQIKLVTTLDPSAGMVFADPAQLQQILLNVVLNARDALGQPKLGRPRLDQPKLHQSKTVQLRTGRLNQMPNGTIRLSTLVTEFPRNAGNPQPAVSLVVEDDGCGMNAETRARLFEPFFTTKKAGEGTGMGLATVQRIVNELGGLIEVTSEPGRGTRMEVFFPALEPVRNAREVDVLDEKLLGSQFLEDPHPKGESLC